MVTTVPAEIQKGDMIRNSEELVLIVNLVWSQSAPYGVPLMQVTESSSAWLAESSAPLRSTGVKLRLPAFTQSQNAVRALVYVESLHAKQSKPNLFLCRSSLTTTVLKYIWMNLSSMYNQTIQLTEMGFFSKGNFLKAAVEVCLRGPRWRNVQGPLVSGGLTVPSGGRMTQRGCLPWIEQGAKRAKVMAQAFGPTQLPGSCFCWPIQPLWKELKS